MNLKQEIIINPKITTTIIWIFCILGIAHELLLGLSRLEYSLVMPHIFFVIGNSYSNGIWSEMVALFFRLFIFFAVIFVSSQYKLIKRLAKALALLKVLGIVMSLAYLLSWFNYPKNFSVYSIILEAALFVALIIKSKNKVRTIFILMFIASLTERFIDRIYNFFCVITSISVDGFIFFAISIFYIICFIKAMSITKAKYRELEI